MELNNAIPVAPDNMPSAEQQLAGNPYVISAAPGTDVSQNFDFQPVSDFFETPTNSDLVIGVDQDYLNMLRPVAQSINKYIPPPNGNIKNPYPGYASPTYDPYAQQRALDLNSREGILRALKNPASAAQVFTPGALDQPQIADPIYSSIRDTNFDRYYAHPKFEELGWQPYANNEEYYNANSSTWDDSVRMWGQFSSLFGTGFVSGYRSIADLFDGDDYLSTPDLESASEFSDAMRIGMSSREGFMAGLNNFTLNSAYTFGIIFNIAAEELALGLATVGSGGGAAPVAAARTGVNVVRAGRAIANFFDVGKALNATRQMIKGLNQADRARDFYNTMRSGGKLVGDFFLPETMAAIREMNTVQNGVQNLSNLSKAARGFGGFYRDVRGINLAMSEAKLEAGMVYNDQFANIAAEINERNGGTGLSSQNVKDAHDNASKAAFATLSWNAPLIYVSNKIVLGTALGGMNKTLGRVFDEKLTGFGKRLIRTKPLTDASGKISRDVFEDAGEGVLGGLLPSMKRIKGYTVDGSLKAAGHGAIRYFATNLTEGVQELAQEAIAVGTKDYYTQLFEDPASAGYDAFKTSFASAVNSQMNSQGFETFMSGFMMGGLVQGPQKLLFQGLPNAMQYTFNREAYDKYKTAKNDYVQNLVKTHNEAWNAMADDPTALFDPNKLNFLVQKQVASEMKQSAYDGDEFGFIDAKDFGKFHQMYTIFNNGTANQFKDQLEGFKLLSDEELNQAFPGFKADIKSGKFRDRIDSTLKQIDDTEKAYNDSKDKFQNPFDKNKFKQGTRDYNNEAMKQLAFEHARYLYMFTQDGFKRALERSESILSDMASEPVISKIAANDLTVLMDIDSIDNELSILEREAQVQPTTPEEEKIVQQKNQRSLLLMGIRDVLTDPKNLTSKGTFHRNKINKLYKPFSDYVKFLADSKNDFVNKDAVLTALKKIVDYGALKERAKVYSKATEYLTNPERLNEILDRSRAQFEKFFQNNRQMFEKSIKKYIKNVEANEFLNKLAKIGVYPDANDTVEFLKTGDVNKLESFYSEDGLITVLNDPKRVLQIEGLIRSYNEITTKEEEAKKSKEEEDEEGEGKASEIDYDALNINYGSAPGKKTAEKSKVISGDEKTSPFGKNILKNVYSKYKAEQITLGNAYLTWEEWLGTKDAKRIAGTVDALKVLWASGIDKNTLVSTYDLDPSLLGTQQLVDAAAEKVIKNDIGFGNWINSQRNNEDVNKILSAGNISFEELLSRPTGKNEGKDSVVKDNKNTKWHKKGPGVNILKVTTTDNEKNKQVYYQLVDNDGKVLSDAILKAAGISTNGVYSKAKAAEEAQKKLLDMLPDTTPFEFDGVTVRFGALVKDKNGKQFIVLGTPGKVAKGGKLFLLPKEKETIKDAREREKAAIKVQEGEFNGNYTVEDLTFGGNIPSNVSKLSFRDFKESYPFENKSQDEIREQAQLRFDTIMTNLTPQQLRDEVEIVVKRNEGAGSETFAYKAGEKDPNTQIMKVIEPFSLGIRISNPSLRARMNEILEEKQLPISESPDDIIGFLPNNQFLFKDKNGNVVSVPDMTDKDYHQFFSNKTYDGAPVTIKDVKDAYGVQQLLIKAISEKLGEENTAVIKFSEISDSIKFIQDSNFDNKSKPAPLTSLQNYSVDDKGTVVIYDNKKVKTEKGFSVGSIPVMWNPESGEIPIGSDEYEEIYERIESELAATGKKETVQKLGRYVAVIRQPNGDLTFAQLKQNVIAKDNVYGFINLLTERAQKTLEENISNLDDLPTDDNGNIKNYKDAVPKDRAFNVDWNNEFNEQFYLAEQPGLLVEFKVSAWGKIEVYFYDKDKETLITKPVTLYQENVKNLVNEPEAFLEGLQNAVDLDETLSKYKIKITPQAFRVSFEKNAPADVIIENTQTTLNPMVRYNYRIIMVADQSRIDSIVNTPTLITRDDVGIATGSISQQSLETIARKLNASEKLTAFEESVFNKYTDSINKIRKELEGKSSLDTSEDTYDGINEMSDDEFAAYADMDFINLSAVIKNQIAAKIYNTGEKSLSPREKQVMRSEAASIINGLVLKLKSEDTVEPSELSSFDNENGSDRKKLEAELKSLISKIEARKDLLKKNNPVKDYQRLLKNDPELGKLIERRRKVEAALFTAGNKIVPGGTLTAYDAETIEQFVTWATNNLPDFINIADINTLRNNLIGNGVRVGAFVLSLADVAGGMKVQGTLYTGASSPFKYHEAFHAVFRMLLTDAQINRLLSIGKKELLAKYKAEGKSYQAEMEKFRNTAPMYREMSPERLEQEFIEEYLADKFEEFKKNPAKTETSPEVKTWFQRLIEWIKSIFKRFTKNELNSLYENIDAGKYKTAAVQNNIFTNTAARGITTEADKLIPIELIRDDKGNVGYKYMDPSVSDGLVANIAAMYLTREDEAIKNSVTGTINPSKILNDTIADFTTMYDPALPTYINLNPEKYDDLIAIYDALSEYSDFVKEAVLERLRLVSVQGEEDNYDFEKYEETEGLRQVSDFKRDQTMMGGWASISQGLKKFIATVTIDSQDEFGNTELTPGERLIVPVNFLDAYNGILKAVKNTTDPNIFFKKLYYFGQSGNPQTDAVVQAIFKKLGITKNMIVKDKMPAEVLDPLFFQQILKGFETYRIDHVFIHINPKDNKPYIYSAANRDDAAAQMDKWSANFDSKFQDMVKDPKKANAAFSALRKLLNSVSPRKEDAGVQKGKKGLAEEPQIKSIDDDVLIETAKKLATNLYNTIGIKLSPGFVAFSIASKVKEKSPYQVGLVDSNKNAEPINAETVSEMLLQIDAAYKARLANEQYTSIFSNTRNVGLPARLKKLAKSNAEFDETVGNSTFKNANNDLVYAHQMATFHLKTVSELNDPKGLDELRESSPYLKNNMLLNSPAFRAMAEQDELRVQRIAGHKRSGISTTDEGEYAETGGINPADEAKTYGDATPKEFILNLINSYTSAYNHSSGKNKTITFTDPATGEEKEVALAPILIRVIEASNTGDSIALPVIKTVQLDETGSVELTEETLDMFIKEIENEYERIKRESNEKTRTEDLLEGYNAKNGSRIDKNGEYKESEGRAYKFTKTGNLLKEIEVVASNRSKVKDPMMSEDTAERLVSGTQSIIIRTSRAANTIGLTARGAAGNIVVNTKNEEGEDVQNPFVMINRGPVIVTDVNIANIIKSLGDAISPNKSNVHKYKVTLGTQIIYASTKDIGPFLQGKKRMFIYDMLKVDDPKVKDILGEYKKEKTFTSFVENSMKDMGISIEEGLIDYKSKLEKIARASDVKNLSFAEAIKDMGISMEEFRSFIENRLMAEYSEFKKTLDEIKATSRISSYVVNGLTTDQGKRNNQTDKAEKQLNLTSDLDYNLMQIFFNDWLNTKAINQILLGDSARSLKDAVDEIKRAKMQNAGGVSVASIITAKEYGIDHTVQKISLFTYSDTQFEKMFSGLSEDGTPEKGDRGDAQMYVTEKGMRYMLFGMGRLNKAQVKLLDKIKDGKKITADEFFGSVGKKGFKDQGAVFNSLKLVYGDGETYLKMSAVMLTKEFTSRKENGQWVAKETKKELHNMRVKLEQFEEQNQTITITGGATAVKMLKRNIMKDSDMFNEQGLTNDNETILDANFMRLQLVNPSNKTIITDPTQIKTLITSEQDDDTDVFILDSTEPVKLGTIREKYNQAISNRVVLKFTSKRNLIFNFDIDVAMDELHKSIKSDKITVNLYSFLNYAVESLKASQSASNIIEFFSPENQDRYNLNNPITQQMFEQLFLRYFNNGVFSEKIPGHSIALMADVGVKVYRRVFSVETLEDGTVVPDRFEVIREKVWEAMPDKPQILFDITDNPTLQGLEEAVKASGKKGVVILDSLRHNLKEYNEKGEYTKIRYSEGLLPAHFKEVMSYVEDAVDDPKTVEEITKEWKSWINEYRWSPKAGANVLRQEIENFDPNRSKKEFAKAFGYSYEENEKGKVVFVTREKSEYLNKIPDVVSKMFGIRIPSQDKHSAVNVKIVDFLPVFYGSTGIFPPQLIEISGADFDIDKLYAHIKEWFVDNGKFVEYGSAKNDKEGYDQYINYVNQTVYKGGSILAEALSKFNGDQGVPGRNQLNIEQILKAIDAGFNQDSIDALSMLGLPVTFEQYKTYKKKNDSEPYEAAINNKILDYKFALLGNEHVANTPDREVPISYEPANIKALTDVWDFIKDELPELAEALKEEGVDVDNLFGKLRAWTSNKEGANSIGAVVLPNLYLSLLKEYNVDIRSIKLPNIGETLPQITLNGYTFRHFGKGPDKSGITGNYEIVDGVEKKDGLRRQYVISALITAMTDNAKERLAAKLGLNKNALGIVANLTALGVPIRTSILLINHPIIKEEYFNAINKSDVYGAGIKTLINKRIKELEDVFPELKSSNVSVTDELLVKAIKNPKNFDVTGVTNSRSFDKKMLLAIAKSEDPEKQNLYTLDDAIDDYSILKQFSNAIRLSRFTAKMGSLMNLSKDIGSSFEDILSREDDINDLGLNLSDEQFKKHNFEGNLAPIDVRSIFKGDTWQATYYRMYRELVDQLLPKVFISRSTPFLNLFYKTLNGFKGGTGNFYLNAERQAKVSKDLLSYLTIKGYMQDILTTQNSMFKASMASLSNSIIYPQANADFNIVSLVQGLREKYKEEGRDNYFLQLFLNTRNADDPSNNTGMNLAESSTFTKLSDMQKIKTQNGFVELYGNPSTRLDALHILHYMMVKDGLQFNYGSLLDAVTPFLLDKYLSGISGIQSVFETGVDTTAFESTFGMPYEELINEFIFNYMLSNKNNFLLFRVNGNNVKVYEPRKQQASIAESIDRVTVANNPDNVYIFGENERNEGTVGQVNIRGLQNAAGIVFKKGYDRVPKNYYKDSEFDAFRELFDETVVQLRDDTRNLVFPARLIGTKDMEYMKKKTPKIYEYINDSLIQNLGYTIEGKLVEKGSSSKVEAAKSPVRIDKSGDVPKLIIDNYNGLFNFDAESPDTRIRRDAFVFKSKPIEKLNENTKAINNAGFVTTTITKVLGKNKQIFTVETVLPPVIRVEYKNFNTDTKRYETYRLTKVYTSTGVKTQNLIPSDLGIPYIFGNRAEYVMDVPVGSNQQNANGFMFNTEEFERPPYLEIRQFVDNKNNKVTEESRLDKIIMAAEPKDELLDTVNFASQPNANASDDELAALGINIGNVNMSSMNNTIKLNSGLGSLAQELKGESNVELTSFWDESIQPNKAAREKLRAQGINSIEDFIDSYTNGMYKSAEDFIDQIKSCIL